MKYESTQVYLPTHCYARELIPSLGRVSQGKNSREDLQEFEWKLEQNIFSLYRDLQSHQYKHGEYTAFSICDPKQRKIHKASVRDRVLHHAVFKILNPIFEQTFIAH